MYCIYHQSDGDGICSAKIVKHKYPHVKLIPHDYGKKIDIYDLQGNDVVLVDISLPMNDMKKLSKISNVTWIDHHQTSMDEAQKVNLNVTGMRKIGKAACELTWEYFFPDQEMPLGVELLGRWDVWDLEWNKSKFNRKNAIIPFQYIFKTYDHWHKNSNEFWDVIFSNKIDKIEEFINSGKFIEKYQQKINKTYFESYSIITELDGYSAIAINRQALSSIDFDSIDCAKYDIKLCFARFCDKYKGDLWKVSMYTDKEHVDVGQIAKKYGEYYGISGGGHRKAAGFIAHGNVENLPFKV